MHSRRVDQVAVFPSTLGWMALAGAKGRLAQLTFGHASPDAALAALDPAWTHAARVGPWSPRLAARLKAFAEGARDDFRDVELALRLQTPFQQRVVDCCRRIAYGTTLTYSQLAAQAGSPRAARAVGNVMASNPVPLIVPCHRVVGAGGGLGGYSAGEGIRLKLRLLELESMPGRESSRSKRVASGT